MLTRSFIFAPGMSAELERSLWRAGVTSWQTLRKHSGQAEQAIGRARTAKLLAAVTEAEAALERGDGAWMREHWPEKETWRLWDGWCSREQVALVDIETTGRTPGYDQITVIGLADGSQARAFVAERPLPGDEPLDDFPEAVRDYRLLVTFNGIQFDVPFIEKHFRAQHFRFAMPHLDLMWPARALGLTGGLKDMEKILGISRDDDIKEIRGNQAITLWGAWRSGDRQAYERLVEYCKADCVNLMAFADAVHQRSWEAAYTPYAQDIDLDAMMGEQLSLF